MQTAEAPLMDVADGCVYVCVRVYLVLYTNTIHVRYGESHWICW